MNKRFLIILLPLIALLVGCKKNDTQTSENFMLNSWIKKEMDYWYYWNTNIPPPTSLNYESEPEDFFYSLLYKGLDKWSYITNDYTELISGTGKKNADLTTGITPLYTSFTNTPGKVMVIVLYVDKGSAAEKAGIKRGYLIEKINNSYMYPDNYAEVFNTNASSITYTYRTSINSSIRNTVSITKTTIPPSPVIKDSVYNLNGRKVGYINLDEYSFEDNFKSEVSESLDKFSSENISDLIIDLRYNGGGYLNSAQWLASAIAPQANILQNNTIVNLKYNQVAGPYVDDKRIEFISTNYNFNISNIVFITSEFTASASELTIIGLQPYMQTYTVGDITAGKCFGSIPIYDENNPITKNYGIQPIVFKYSNSEGFSDFTNGLIPDITIEESYGNLKALGDLNDPLLAAAINIITPVAKKVMSRETEQADFQIVKLPQQGKVHGLIGTKPTTENSYIY